MAKTGHCRSYVEECGCDKTPRNIAYERHTTSKLLLTLVRASLTMAHPWRVALVVAFALRCSAQYSLPLCRNSTAQCSTLVNTLTTTAATTQYTTLVAESSTQTVGDSTTVTYTADTQTITSTGKSVHLGMRNTRRVICDQENSKRFLL